MKFWKSFSVEIKDWDLDVLGYEIPKGYAYGYREFTRMVTHYYLFPFNYLVQLWRLFLYRVVYGARPLEWERRIHRRVREGYEAGYDRGYKIGCAEGYDQGALEVAAKIEAEIKKRLL